MSSKPNLNQKITGVILSGGAGSRFGGLDKGLQTYKGTALIEHVIQRLSGQVDDLVLCVNRNHSKYQQYGYQLVSDQGHNGVDYQEPIYEGAVYQGPTYEGPMAGIVSALKTFGDPELINPQSILVSSCDSPLLPLDYVGKLNAAMVNNNTSSVVVYDGERSQNLHCLIHSSAWNSVSEFYQRGERAMYKWHKKNGSVEVNFSNQAADFLNINSKELLS